MASAGETDTIPIKVGLYAPNLVICKTREKKKQQQNRPDRMLDEACVGYCFNFRCPNY